MTTRLSWLHYPVLVLFVGTLVLWFTASLRPVESSLQYDFDSWLSGQRESLQGIARFAVQRAETENQSAKSLSPNDGPASGQSGDPSNQAAAFAKAIEQPVPLEQLPSLQAEVFRVGANSPAVYRVTPALSPDRPQQILRLLELMKESGIFSQSEPAIAFGPDEGVVRIVVHGPSRSFEAVLSRPAVEGNIKALLLLKLFAEFSAAPPPTASDSAQQVGQPPQHVPQGSPEDAATSKSEE